MKKKFKSFHSRIVNDSKIPESIFNYLSIDNYDYKAKGDSFSATELLNPVQVILLKRRHADEITVDAADRLWVMLGNGVHAILENEKGIEPIERLTAEVLGVKISGKWDRIKNNKITDYKVTSAFTVMYRSREQEWMEQLSIYRWLYFKRYGVLLDSKGYIVALLRDWAAKELSNARYPRAGAVEIELNLMSPEETEDFLEHKIKKIKKAEKVKDKDLPKCTDKERWWNENKKVFNRCARYCEAAAFCVQYNTELVSGKK